MILESTITCPQCATKKSETMPTDACWYFYTCTGCGASLRPKPGDCCVFCSYGSVPCPPIEAARSGAVGALLCCAGSAERDDPAAVNGETPMPAFVALDAYWRALEPHLRRFAPDEQRIAVALYRELAKGEAVDDTQLARALGIPVAESRALLDRESIRSVIYRDGHGRVLGFGGLAAAPMHHSFKVNGRALSTWCAWDSLFLPEILSCTAEVASPDPESGQLVQLVVTPERIASVEPASAVISFLRPEAGVFGTSAANVMAKFCYFIYFFASRASGERWTRKHPSTFLSPLDEAFALARRFNRHNFGAALGPLAP